jgi:hypothetical protein
MNRDAHPAQHFLQKAFRGYENDSRNRNSAEQDSERSGPVVTQGAIAEQLQFAAELFAISIAA